RREPSLDAVAHLKNVHREHLAIVEALQIGDGDLAADIMGQHLHRAKEVTLDYFDAHANVALLSDSEDRGMPLEEVSRKIAQYRRPREGSSFCAGGRNEEACVLGSRGGGAAGGVPC